MRLGELCARIISSVVVGLMIGSSDRSQLYDMWQERGMAHIKIMGSAEVAALS